MSPDFTQQYGRLKGVYYGWWLVAISGFVMVIAIGPLFHAMSVWAVAMERQFGWSRAQLGWALTFTRIEGGIMGPLEGIPDGQDRHPQDGVDRAADNRGRFYVLWPCAEPLDVPTWPTSLWLWGREWGAGSP